MDRIDCDVAVIGAGTAGLSAYRAATAAGVHAVIIEQGPPGTTCTRVGCMPSKLLIAAARAADRARKARAFGIHTGLAEVDGPAVMKRVQRERDQFVASVLEDYFAISPDCRIAGRARFTGPTALALDDGREIAAKAVVIATGSTSAIPDALAPVRDRLHTNETIFDLEAPPGSLAVLGAGALGLELAQAFARLGSRVVVIDKADMVGGLSDHDAAQLVFDALSRELHLHLGCEVTAEPGPGRQVRLAWSGAAEGSDLFDTVLVAAGRPPLLDGLDLGKADLALDDRGTPLFDPATRRCGDGMIFIAGDAGGSRPVLHEAVRGGETAGRNAARPDRMERRAVLPALTITFTEPQIAEIGVGGDPLPAGAATGCARFDGSGRVQIDNLGSGILRLHAARDGALLGATVVGPEAEHVAHLIALAVNAGLTAAELADQAYYHPTIAEVLQDAARDLVKQLQEPR